MMSDWDFTHAIHMMAGRTFLWCYWRRWSWRRTLSTFVRGGGWHRGEWVSNDPKLRGTSDYWREASR